MKCQVPTSRHLWTCCLYSQALILSRWSTTMAMSLDFNVNKNFLQTLIQSIASISNLSPLMTSVGLYMDRTIQTQGRPDKWPRNEHHHTINGLLLFFVSSFHFISSHLFCKKYEIH